MNPNTFEQVHEASSQPRNMAFCPLVTDTAAKISNTSGLNLAVMNAN